MDDVGINAVIDHIGGIDGIRQDQASQQGGSSDTK